MNNAFDRLEAHMVKTLLTSKLYLTQEHERVIWDGEAHGDMAFVLDGGGLAEDGIVVEFPSLDNGGPWIIQVTQEHIDQAHQIGWEDLAQLLHVAARARCDEIQFGDDHVLFIENEDLGLTVHARK